MITNTINSLSKFNHIDDELSPETLAQSVAQLELINKAEAELNTADVSIAALVKQPASAEILAMIAAQQKQVVMAMVGANPEQAIAMALAQSIEAYGKQLETIQRWTNGGKDAFEAAIWEMYMAMNSEGLDGIDYENMYQLVLLDVLINADEYGLGDDQNFIQKLGSLLEKIGSGSHTNWDYTPEQIGTIVESTWSTIYGKIASGDIPENSLAYQAMSHICDGAVTPTPPQEFKNQFNSSTYNDPQAGGWITDDLDTLSPMTRMVILSNLMRDNALSQEQVDVILTGKKSDIDQAVQAITGTGQSALDFLFEKCGAWQDSYNENGSLPDGVSQALDYAGTISASYLESLYTNFPMRELTDEEIEEINSIGDKVKMLQETLKYWISICRDEQVAVARNI